MVSAADSVIAVIFMMRTGDRTGAAGTGGPLPRTPVRSGVGGHLSSSSRAGLELADRELYTAEGESGDSESSLD